jgi:hypothetical protein
MRLCFAAETAGMAEAQPAATPPPSQLATSA